MRGVHLRVNPFSFQMIMMGVLGEYIWRNLDESRKRPLYVIEKLYGHSGEHDSEKNPEEHSDPEDGKENRGE